jgi:hypothetical protein
MIWTITVIYLLIKDGRNIIKNNVILRISVIWMRYICKNIIHVLCNINMISRIMFQITLIFSNI